MTHLQNFLLNNPENGLQLLESVYFVSHVRHKTFPNLVLFKYDQINSPMSDLIVQESRGIILDQDKQWSIVVYPYQKFFNLKELNKTPEIDWKRPVRVYEKIDGSLLTLYYYNGTWHVATSGVPDASGKLHWGESTKTEEGESSIESTENVETASTSTSTQEESGKSSPLSPVGDWENRKTFAQLFWEVFNLNKYQLPNDEIGQSHCYMFELATPQNRVLIPFSTPELYIHGARNMITLEEQLPDLYSKSYGWKIPPMHIITKGKAEFESVIMPQLTNMDGLKQEGFVICDSSFNRFKLKCTSYVNMALLYNKDGNEWKRMVAIIQINEGSEFLAYFPKFKPLYDQLYTRYELVIHIIKTVYEYTLPADSKKLAEISSQLPAWIKGPLFSLRKQNQNVKHYFSSPSRYSSLCDLLDPSRKDPEMPNLESIKI